MRAAMALVLVSCGGDLCEADAVTEALSAAAANPIVTLGDCRIPGDFTVPSGVEMRGAPAGRTVIVGGVVLTPGSTMADLDVEVDGGFGVLSRGAGETTVERARIEVKRGVGLGFEDLNHVTLLSVEVVGPVTVATASSFPADADPSTHATHGIAMVRVGEVALTDVDVSGFAQIGVAAAGSTIAWERGTLLSNLGVALAVESGGATLEAVRVSQTFQGLRLLPAFGGLFSASAIDSTGLVVEQTEGKGLLHYGGGRASHTALTASLNEDAALWAQGVSSLEVQGSSFADNMFAGVVAVDLAQLTIESTDIERTGQVPRILHTPIGDRVLNVGDGIHLVRASDAAELRGLMLENNERAGILIDLDGGLLDDMRFTAVTITVTSTAQVALLAQNGMLAADWDQGVTRNGTTRADDLAKGPLDPVQGTGPCDRPVQTGLMTSGLGLLGAP